jgi:hypothetical protein
MIEACRDFFDFGGNRLVHRIAQGTRAAIRADEWVPPPHVGSQSRDDEIPDGVRSGFA